MCLILRLYTTSKQGSFAQTLLNSPMYKDVVKNNVDMDTSFGKMRNQINKTLTQPNAAIFYEENYVKNKMLKYDCKYKVLSLKSIKVSQTMYLV